MHFDEVDIGKAAIPGQRVAIQDRIDILFDSRSLFEIIVLRLAPSKGGEIMSADPNGAYDIERQDGIAKIDINCGAIAEQDRILLGVYATSGPLPDILATISQPRTHVPLRSGDASGIVAFEIYKNRDQWRVKVDGSPYKEGLPAILSAHSNRS